MAGRILDKSIAEVREKARIEDVISQYVTLRNAGGGSLKGLCPFHDEKSPSFNVTPSRQFFHCFGCNEGGDVIAFLMKIDGLSFGETVERLADKVGVVLEREEGWSQPQERRGPGRGQLIEAHKVAAEFYAEQLMTPGAVKARQFLAERSFDQAVAQQFGVGFAPTDGKSLHQHLRGRGFTEEELVAGGLGRQSGWDVFQGRLVWPIREAGGDVIGFGARKLFDDDRIAGKYINTSETPIYKKNQVLYGIDLARMGMRSTGQAVVVEGYTDVMACHLAGVTTAVASCGTAFTTDHGKIVRRFMGDFDGAGEIVFTFDGDAAGQAAAMKVFASDADYVGQTYVAVAAGGFDPCDLRIQQGDEAVRALIAAKRPLYRFVLGNVVNGYDLDRADGRVDALREGARLVSSVRDKSKVGEFTRELAGMVGVDVDSAVAEVRRVQSPGRRTEAVTPTVPTPAQQDLPEARDPRFLVEREVLKALLQHPMVVGTLTGGIAAEDFVHPAYRALWALMETAGGLASGSADPQWAANVRAKTDDPRLAQLVSALAVEAIPDTEPDAAYVTQFVARLRTQALDRRIADTHSRLQRLDPADSATMVSLLSDLKQMEAQRRGLVELSGRG